LVEGSIPSALTAPSTHKDTNTGTSTSVNLLDRFLASRRQGISPGSLKFYRTFLSPFLMNYPLTAEGVNHFLSDLHCGNAKLTYYRAIRVLCNWAVREKIIVDNPIKHVDAPKIKSMILPSLSEDEVNYLITQAETTRDSAIISLFADSGMRLSELTNVKLMDIDWDNHTITIWGKGGKQRKAPFTERTTRLLKEYLSSAGTGDNIWHLNIWGIISILRRLKGKTGLPCNPHTFRRTFASNLHRRGLDVEHIMRLGGWESLDMVLRYTKSVKFEDSLRVWKALS
jgi:site-specific recombinase XerD